MKPFRMFAICFRFLKLSLLTSFVECSKFFISFKIEMEATNGPLVDLGYCCSVTVTFRSCTPFTKIVISHEGTFVFSASC